MVQEFGYDSNADDEFRYAVEDHCGAEIEDDDYTGGADAVLLWWRDGDGDLGDALVDMVGVLDDGGFVVLLTPKVNGDVVDPSDIDEAAVTAAAHGRNLQRRDELARTSGWPRGPASAGDPPRPGRTGRIMTSTLAPLEVGHVAPDFTLRDQTGVAVSLAELTAHKNVVVVFFPFAFSGICTGGSTRSATTSSGSSPTTCRSSASPAPHVLAARLGRRPGYFFPLLSDYWRTARSPGVRGAQRRPAPPSAARSSSAATASCAGPWSTGRASGATSAAWGPRSRRCAEGCHTVRGRPTALPGVTGGWGL